MKLVDILPEIELDESAIRQFKRFGNEIKRYFKCTSGPKAGSYASSPSACGKRKDPRKVKHGKKVARSQKSNRVRKTMIRKRSAASKMLKRMNQRLASNKPKQHTSKFVGNKDSNSTNK
jgi:hypothetical protein